MEELLFPVRKDGKFGFINESGRVVIDFDYDWARDFSEGLAGVRYDEKWDTLTVRGTWLFHHSLRPYWIFQMGWQLSNYTASGVHR